MNTIPDRIFLQWFGDETNPDPNDNVLVSEVSWNLERVFDADIEYNRANALPAVQAQLAEAVELLRQHLGRADDIIGRVDDCYRDALRSDFEPLYAFLAKVDAP